MSFVSKKRASKSVIAFGNVYSHQKRKRFNNEESLNQELELFHNDRIQSFYLDSDSSDDFDDLTAGINKKLDYKFNNKDLTDYER